MELFRYTPSAAAALPVLANLPHSGTFVPEPIRALFLPAHASALYNTDWYLPQLYDFLPQLGVATLEATHSRYVIDLNRAQEAPLWGSFFGAKIAEQTAHKTEIYAQRPTEASLQAREQHYYRPYHDALSQRLEALVRQHGRALLLDLHSFMGPITEDVCLGDANSQACDPQITAIFAEQLSAQGFEVVTNKVFNGGGITRRYGAWPKVQAIQIELRYTNYLAAQELDLDRMPRIIDRALFASAQERLRCALRAAFARL